MPVSEGLGGAMHIEATLHPDTTFAGARANVFVAIGLEQVRMGSAADCGTTVMLS